LNGLAGTALLREDYSVSETEWPPATAAFRLVERTPAELAAPDAAARWDALAGWASTPNPFYESWYLLPSLAALDPRGKVKLLCLEADGLLAGLLPVRSEISYYGYPFPHLRNWAHANCFLGAPLVARGCEAEFWRALLGWADRNAAGAVFLHLAHMPLDGTLHGALREVLAWEGRQAALVQREERALLKTSLSPDAYLESALKPKRRSELARKRRRLSDLGTLAISRQVDAAGIEEWTNRFLELERGGWKGRARSAMACSSGTESLFREALHGAAKRGRLDRLELSLDGRPVAMMTTFLTPPGAFGFKTAFDEEFARFSPGALLQQEALSLLDRGDILWCDSCAAADHPLVDHFWRERRAIGRISVAIGGPLRRTGFAAIARAEKGEPL